MMFYKVVELYFFDNFVEHKKTRKEPTSWRNPFLGHYIFWKATVTCLDWLPLFIEKLTSSPF